MRFEDYLAGVSDALHGVDREQLARAAVILDDRSPGSAIYVIGNGGSAATASHFVNDLIKRAGVRALSLMDQVPTLTAYANDTSYADGLAHLLAALDTRPCDTLVAITTSGRSANILIALDAARQRGMSSLALVGEPSSLCAELATVAIHTPGATQQQQEDLAGIVCHMLVEALREGDA